MCKHLILRDIISKLDKKYKVVYVDGGLDTHIFFVNVPRTEGNKKTLNKSLKNFLGKVRISIGQYYTQYTDIDFEGNEVICARISSTPSDGNIELSVFHIPVQIEAWNREDVLNVDIIQKFLEKQAEILAGPKITVKVF